MFKKILKELFWNNNGILKLVIHDTIFRSLQIQIQLLYNLLFKT